MKPVTCNPVTFRIFPRVGEISQGFYLTVAELHVTGGIFKLLVTGSVIESRDVVTDFQVSFLINRFNFMTKSPIVT